MRYLPILVLAFVMLVAAPPSGASVIVENYTGTYIYTIALPGNPVGGGVDFSSAMTYTSLDFTPGSVSFAGMPVDFDGTEADFLATTHNGTVNVPVNLGPGTVPTTWTIVSTGPALNADWVGGHDAVQLGPAFSQNAFDVVVNSISEITADTSNWTSAVVPELNGALVTLSSRQTVLSVDLLNGIISGSEVGSFEAKASAVPAITIWGVALMAMAIAGAFWLFLRRRREGAGPQPA